MSLGRVELCQESTTTPRTVSVSSTFNVTFQTLF